MIRKIAWDTFKNTGDINAFLELKQIENIENEMNKEKGNKENGKYNKKIKTKTQKKENAVAAGETRTGTACDSTDESGRSVPEPTAQT